MACTEVSVFQKYLANQTVFTIEPPKQIYLVPLSES